MAWAFNLSRIFFKRHRNLRPLNQFDIYWTILCLIPKTTVTSLMSAPNYLRCKTHPVCLNLWIIFWTCEKRHMLYTLTIISNFLWNTRIYITVLLEMTQKCTILTGEVSDAIAVLVCPFDRLVCLYQTFRYWCVALWHTPSFCPTFLIRWT